MTPTVGIASRSVSLASAPRSVTRRTSAKAPATIRIVNTITASRPLFLAGGVWSVLCGMPAVAGSGLFCSVICVIFCFCLGPGINFLLGVSFLRRFCFSASVNHTEDHRHKEQGSYGGKYQPSDHGA